MRPARLILAALIAAAAFAGGVVAAPTTASALAFGVYTPGMSLESLDSYEALVAHHQGMFLYYQNWDNVLDADLVAALHARDTTPVISWEPYGHKLSDIAAGTYDTYISAYARQCRDIGGTIYLRPMHEMNGNWYPWGCDDGNPAALGNTPAVFRAAFIHMVNVFRAEGADNVRFVFSPANESPPYWDASTIPDYFPGDAYVDLISIDGYNFGTVMTWASGHSTWRTFDQIFKNAYTVITVMSQRPVIIGETGSVEAGGDKAAWITSTVATIKSDYPRITALIWYDAVTAADFRVNTTPASLGAYRAAMQSDHPVAALTISSSTASTRCRVPFVLQGTLRPGAPGVRCVVYVRKPGSMRWSYSSARLTGAPGVHGAAPWWYRYKPLLRGTYRFNVRYAGDTNAQPGASRTIAVAVR